MIEVEHLDGGAITEFRVLGSVTFEQVTGTIEATYARAGPAILWDISKGSLVALRTNEMTSIARLVARLRPGGYTAYVGPEDLEFGLLRMYEGMSGVAGARHEPAVFRERDEALRWLRSRLQREAEAESP